MKVCCVIMILSALSSCGSKKSYHAHADTLVSLAREELASTHRSEGSLRRALVLLDRAVQLKRDPATSALRATALWRLGDRATAREIFEMLLQQKNIEHAVRAEINNNFACLLAEAGCTDQALARWDALLHDVAYLTPECAFINQGSVFAQMGKDDAARESFEAAIRLAPSAPEGYIALARFALARGDRASARSALDALNFLAPASEAAAMLRAQLVNTRELLRESAQNIA